MLEDRDYMRQTRAMPQWSATIALIVVNALVYIFQYYLLPRIAPAYPFEENFALSLDGLRAGHVWQLLTYQFMHGGFWHIFLNCWAIFVFGRVIEATMGKRRMLTLYFLSGIMGRIVANVLRLVDAGTFWRGGGGSFGRCIWIGGGFCGAFPASAPGDAAFLRYSPGHAGQNVALAVRGAGAFGDRAPFAWHRLHGKHRARGSFGGNHHRISLCALDAGVSPAAVY